MEGICIGNGVVIGIEFIFGLFGAKTRGSCVYNKTAEKKEVSAVLLHWTLHINWWDNNLLGLLVVL